MVTTCNNCGAFLGLQEPLASGEANGNFLCPQCARDPLLRLRDYLSTHPRAAPHEVVTAMATVGAKVNERMVEYVRQFLTSEEPDSLHGDKDETLFT